MPVPAALTPANLSEFLAGAIANWNGLGSSPEGRSFMVRTRKTNEVGLKVDPYCGEGEMSLSIMEGENAVTTLTIDTKSASSIAAAVLAGAKKAFDASGKPPPNRSRDELIELTAISCSGWTIGPGHQDEPSVMLIFHFGETSLGIRIPEKHAQLLGQLLMTASAPEDQSRRQ